jgi:hypothetical protein
VVIGSLTSLLVAGISSSEAIDDELEAAATTALTAGADFVSDEQLSEALSDTELTNDEQEAIVDANAAARIGALQQGMVAASLLALLALFFTARVPKAPLAAPGDPDDDVEPPVPSERSANA